MLNAPSLSTNLFLVGPMGVGKSTIGRQLATALNMDFKDSDREIELRTGATVTLIFELEGETGFRKREKAMIAELTKQTNLVLATGGGVVLDPDNRAQLNSHGYVIYLHASVQQLLERTAHSRNRPLLNGDLQGVTPEVRLNQLFKERHPLYQMVADMTVETGNRTIHQVVKHILKHIQQPRKMV